ncbi:cellulose binding domain-containing protein [Actinacidiphila epipremni]|uniref:cellulose binding domain-containing protein n=1 Tax=Actinacidiphila epipremni TaxID=2053013 RepID=UPI002AFE4771|nr:cellulose binding domain-containing protein [Actinacidiphila epipremni]
MKNTGSSSISGWKVSWTQPSGSTITQMWNATQGSSGALTTATNASYNGALGGGASTTFGYTANGTAGNPALSCTSS